MKKLLFFLFIAQALTAQETKAAKAPESEQHEFVISNFKTESGVTLPQARVEQVIEAGAA